MDVIFGKGVGSRASVVWTMESAVGAVSCGDGVVVGVCAASCVGEVGEHPAAGISAFAELLDVVGTVVAGVYCHGAGGGTSSSCNGLYIRRRAGALSRGCVIATHNKRWHIFSVTCCYEAEVINGGATVGIARTFAFWQSLPAIGELFSLWIGIVPVEVIFELSSCCSEVGLEHIFSDIPLPGAIAHHTDRRKKGNHSDNHCQFNNGETTCFSMRSVHITYGITPTLERQLKPLAKLLNSPLFARFFDVREVVDGRVCRIAGLFGFEGGAELAGRQAYWFKYLSLYVVYRALIRKT